MTKLVAGRAKNLEAVRKVAAIHFRSLDLARMRAEAARLASTAPALPAMLERAIEEAGEIDRLASEPPAEEAP